ncbi:PadR family transcriptional regulator [Bacillus changyiensis]|uniref:PadR family transcriptional regulator n=1 Tax=Bacillus changyiensis TaxID=3004103 RepID=UPI0022DF83AF|nr:PadR family transcriptional regulator [Bacillus changyiensis]MDA1476336.1 PadR family transcriptional regulator [Bacillus changyiensis]
MSGYDITSEFKKAIGQFWSAKHSQIYVELKKLLEENSISQYIKMAGVKLEKKMYSLTTKGKEELRNWLLELDKNVETEKDIFALRLYFLKDIPTEEIPVLFKNQLKLRTEKLSFLKEQFSFHFGGEKNPLQLDAEALGHYFVLTKAISREENYINWLNKSLDMINKQES